MEQLAFAMEEMEKDSCFEKALVLLRMKRQMHKSFLQTSPKVLFSPGLHLEQLSYYKYSASVFWRQPEYNQRTEYAGFIPG